MATDALGLFAPGFLLGGFLALLLAGLGVLLRVRDEALAAFSYTQVAVLGAIVAALLGIPVLLGAWGLALLLAGFAAVVWSRAAQGAASRSLVVLLTAWGLGLLLADNHPQARLLTTSSVEGQLMLVSWQDLPGFIGLGLLGVLLLASVLRPWLAMNLLAWRRSGAGATLVHVTRETAVVAMLASGALSLGVFVTLALVLIPAWVVWQRASSLRQALLSAMLLAVVCHVLAFGLTLALDQVYAAVMVVVLVACGLSVQLAGRLRPHDPSQSS